MKESFFIKKILIILCLLLFVCIGSIHAADDGNSDESIGLSDKITVNSSDKDFTMVKAFNSKIIASDKVNKSSNVISQDNTKLNSNTKSFSDLAKKIDSAKDGSVVVLSGKYKYDPEKDKDYTKGIKISKNIKIVGKNKCSIDGGGKVRGLIIESHCKVTIKKVTFKHLYSRESNGAAIFSYGDSKIIIRDCIFSKNVVYKANGGAIASGPNTNLDIHDSKFYHNKALRGSDKSWPNDQKGMGGAIQLNIGSKLTLYHSSFKHNLAYLSIILVMSNNKDIGTKTSTVHVEKCLFENNSARINGVFYLDEYGKGTFLKSTFKKNHSKDKGGTLILDASKYALVKNCRFVKNSGEFGGAIDLYKYNKKTSKASVVGCSFIKNKADDAGGAIFSDYGKLKIVKSKFIKNKAGVSGGAVEVRGGKLSLIKTVFKVNRAQCGGALLVKDKKCIHAYQNKFVKNNATVNGKNILGIFNHEVSKVKFLH